MDLWFAIRWGTAPPGCGPCASQCTCRGGIQPPFLGLNALSVAGRLSASVALVPDGLQLAVLDLLDCGFELSDGAANLGAQAGRIGIKSRTLDRLL